MKVKVNEDACIGCGACQAIADEIFELNDEGVSEVKIDTIDEALKDQALEAMESCPTGAIVEE